VQAPPPKRVRVGPVQGRRECGTLYEKWRQSAFDAKSTKARLFVLNYIIQIYMERDCIMKVVEKVKSLLHIMKVELNVFKILFEYRNGYYVAMCIFLLLIITFSIVLPKILILIMDTKQYHVLFGNSRFSDLLNYLGCIIGALVTTLGIILTLNHNQKNINEQIKQNSITIKEQGRLNVLPLLSLSNIMLKSPEGSIEMTEDFNIIEEPEKTFSFESLINVLAYDENKWVESPISEIIISFTENGIEMHSKLLEKHKKILKESSISIDNGSAMVMYNDIPVLYLPFYLTNLGVGAAINFNITILDNNSEERNLLSYMRQSFNLKVGQGFRLLFFAEKLDYVKYINLDFSYYDIYGKGYTQSHGFFYSEEKKYIIFDTNIHQESMCVFEDGFNYY